MLGFRYVICVISFRIARHEEGGNDEDEKSQGEQTTFLREVLYIDIDIYTRLSSLSLFSFLVRSFFEEGPGGRLFARNIGVIVIVVAVSPGRYCHLAL